MTYGLVVLDQCVPTSPRVHCHRRAHAVVHVFEEVEDGFQRGGLIDYGQT